MTLLSSRLVASDFTKEKTRNPQPA